MMEVFSITVANDSNVSATIQLPSSVQQYGKNDKTAGLNRIMRRCGLEIIGGDKVCLVFD